VPLNRRGALRVATALAAGVVGAGGCDPSGPPPVDRSATAGAGPASPVPPSPVATGARPTPTPLPPEIIHGPWGRPNVALTFHGEGDPALARQVLAELERGGARVTVFAVGAWLADQPTMARRVLDGGHELGNHTENHRDIGQMTAAQTFGEIDACAQRIKKLTGSVGTWFRPSRIRRANAMIKTEATRVGYPTCVSYDVDSLDYTDPGSSAVVDTTLREVRSGSIVSLHLGHRGTLDAIGPILDGLHQRGLRPVLMQDLMA
jgi:peptidoglycan/xylan/chitin deacetylase (PgdA/CDA1 family)